MKIIYLDPNKLVYDGSGFKVIKNENFYKALEKARKKIHKHLKGR